VKEKAVVLTGRPISHGIAVGRAEVHLEDPSIVPVYRLESAAEVDAEIEALSTAMGEAAGEADQDVDWAKGNLPESEAEIFCAQRAILRDPALVEWVESRIRSERVNAAAAVRHRFDEFRSILQRSPSEIIRNRILDVSDAERLILARLLDQPRRTVDGSAARNGDPIVLVTNDPPPSVLARMDPEYVVGILCEEGAGMGHIAVLARALNLPALVQVKGLLAQVREGDTLAIDADEGSVTVNPPPPDLEKVRIRERKRRRLLPPAPSDPRASRVTVDGVRIRLLGNVGSQREVNAAAQADADGVGLYRTEFLYLAKDKLPTEAELVSTYAEAARSFTRDPVDIRLPDLGSDKHLPGIRSPSERNPALGLRSLRFLFAHPGLLKTQIRALLQAAADGPLRTMLPMVSSVDEILRVREIVAESHEELRREGLRHDPDLPIGAMIEHPAGVLMAPEILREADFVSLGTNDLTMYVLAVDRGAAHLTSYYDPFHPAMLRVLSGVAERAEEEGKPLSVCGEIAGDPTLTGILIGLGLTRLSMAPQWIVPMGQVVSTTDTRSWRELVAQAVRVSSPEGIRQMVRDLIGTT
jgi:phosphotransferase system enzyme I (PtsI)